MLLDDVPQYSFPIYEQHLIKLPACVIPWSPSTLGPELILYLVEYNQSMSVTHYMDLRLGFLSCIIHFQWYFHVFMHWNIPIINILFFPGSLKKGSNYVHSVKLMKVNGSVLSINISPSLVHLAVGSDQGYVSFFSFLSFSMALFLVYLQVQRKKLGHGAVRDWTWTIIDSAMLEKCDSRDRVWAGLYSFPKNIDNILNQLLTGVWTVIWMFRFQFLILKGQHYYIKNTLQVKYPLASSLCSLIPAFFMDLRKIF